MDKIHILRQIYTPDFGIRIWVSGYGEPNIYPLIDVDVYFNSTLRRNDNAYVKFN